MGALLTAVSAVTAQQIVEVLPLTDRIVMVHLDEGFVNKHTLGQKRGDESVVRTELNVGLATTLTTYQLSSTNDPAYGTAKSPVDLGRKSKGTDYAFLCQNWGPNGCVNTDADHAKEHWLYLYLPTPLQRGKAYTLNTGAVGSNGSTWNFTYDEKTIRSEAVHINQMGYKPNAALKYGYVYHWLGNKGGLDLTNYAGKDFWVVNTANNTVAFSGKLVFRKSKTNPETGQPTDSPNANFSSADVYECNFSGLTTPGTYRLAVEGVGASFEFAIGNDVYTEPFTAVMNGLFKNRSGIAITAGPISDHNRPAPHNPGVTPGFSNRLFYSTARAADYVTDGGSSAERATAKAAFEAGKKGNINTWGFYQDAGDWDGYFSHSRVPADLLFLYESFPTKFTDNSLKLAETGNGIPDLLDEARWLPRYYKRTKDAIVANGWGDGGVGGSRIFGDLWGGDERPDGTTKASWTDTDRDWYVSGADVWTTFRYAGLAAHMAYNLSLAGATDPENINWQQEAIDAYAWALSKQTPADETPKGDYVLRYDRLYAAAMLYKLTGTEAYHTQFKTDFNALDLNGIDLQDDGRLGLWAYATLPANRTADATILAAIRAKAVSTGDEILVNSANRRAARWGGNWFFPMLVGQGTSPMITQGIMAYCVLRGNNPAKASEYLPYIATTADYFLGNNPLNQTWVTGMGKRYPRELFHMDGWYSGATNTTRSGIVPYGQWRTSNPRPAQIGWWDIHWAEKTITPANLDTWPGHERWFDQRPTPLSSEFTVHQTQRWSIMAFGFLNAVEEPPFTGVPVTGVTINPTNLTVVLGRTSSATATVQPGNATNQGVTWSSNNTGVATVGSDGTITGVAEGSAVVTVTTAEGNFSQAVNVTVVRRAVTGISVSPTSLTVRVGRTGSLSATVQPTDATNANITWSSSNTSVATVANGVVTGVTEGTATITVTTADGNFQQSVNVTVSPLVGFTCSGNLAVNGDVEAPDITAGASTTNSGFQSFGNATLADDAVSGVQAIKLSNYMHQIIFNPAIKKYTLRVKIKRQGNTNYAGMKLAFQNSANQELPGAIETNITNTDYQEIALGPLDAPAGADKLLMQFFVGGGFLLIDDVCLTAQDIADTQAPSTPANLSVVNALSQSVQLGWTASTDNVAVTKYEIHQNGTKVGESTTNAFSVTGLTAGTSYTFTVKAFDGAGNVSSESNAVTATTLLSDPRYELLPTDDKDNDGNGTRATVNHSQFTNAYYKFNLAGVSGTPTRALLRLNKTDGRAMLAYLGVFADDQDGWTETGSTNPQNATTISTRYLPSGTGSVIEFDVTNYVLAELGAGRNKIASFQVNNHIGNWVSLGTKENAGPKPQLIISTAAFTDSQAPTAPTGLTATEQAQTGFRLSWAIATDNVGVISYEVFNGANKIGTVSAELQTLLVKNLTSGTGYSFTVRAVDGAGNGTSSAALAVTTAAASATSIVMTTTDDTGTPDNAIGTAPYATLSQWNNSFARFDLANVQGTVSNAKLRLFAPNAITMTLKNASTKSWSERNQSSLPSPTDPVLKTASSSTNNTYVEFDVTDLVQSVLTGDKLLSWAINHTAGNWLSWRTKEDAVNIPQLVLTLVGETAPTVAPTFSGLPASGTACTGSSTTLTASCASGAVTWQGTPQGTISGAAIVLPTAAGTYNYTAVCANAAGSGPSATTSLTLSTPAAPNWANAGGQQSATVTQNASSVTFVATNCTGQLNWTGPNSTSGTGSIIVSTSQTGTFVYGGTCSIGSCVSSPANVTVTVMAPALKVQYADGDNGQLTNNNIKPYLRIVNDANTPVPLGDLKMRYWFTAENFADINTWIDHAQLGNSYVQMKYFRTEQPRSGADGYIEYSFAQLAGDLWANGSTGPIQSRFANKDWAELSEADDYSYRAGSNYANHDRVTLYRKDAQGNWQLIWGTEPAVVPAVQGVRVLTSSQSSGANAISTFLKIENTGNVPIRYEDLNVRYWFTSEGGSALTYSLDYAKLGNGNVTSQFTRLNPARTKADVYVEMAFKPSLGSLFPRSNTGNIQYRINKADWSNFDQANDHSYLSGSTFAENSRVTVYHKGQLIYGTEPPAAGGRLPASETTDTWEARLLVNPSPDRDIRVEIRGAEGQSLRLSLTDIQGRVVAEQHIDAAGAVEERSLDSGSRNPGLFLLHVNTARKSVTLRALRQ
ncbi:hypothetical protein AWR27_17890 [Spirosoma montaniterrae]|uniref:Uncharacterized protein n=1 Tax=Spirosoma montaniterrae TaxID=1178516 RepID=A0A1P9X064_9BACT|nr:hypothetical protein AWR27_17890 [Spirosoma montaniterrae]